VTETQTRSRQCHSSLRDRQHEGSANQHTESSHCARRLPSALADFGSMAVECVDVSCLHPPSCPPLAPPELPGFHATTGALTPEQPALRTGRFHTWNPAHEHRSVCRSGLPASRHQIFRPFHLQPPVAAPEDRFWFNLRGLPRLRSGSAVSTFPCLKVSLGLRH